MCGSITIKSYCLVKDGKAYEGSKEDIVERLVNFKLDDNRILYYKIRVGNYPEIQAHSYGEKWIPSEMYQDVINFLFNKLKECGFKEYKQYQSINQDNLKELLNQLIKRKYLKRKVI